jgi:DNA-nicking Smr family endonuclease
MGLLDNPSMPDACNTIPAPRQGLRRRARTHAVGHGPPRDDITDDDDAALFRAAIGPVTPLRAPARAVQVMPPRPRTRVAEREAHEVAGEFRRLLESHPQLEAGDHSSHRQPQVPPHPATAASRTVCDPGRIGPARRHRAAGAPAAARFHRRCAQHGHGCVRIIHGKGHQSDSSAPVLKNLVDQWLRLRSDVLAFHSAPPAQGARSAGTAGAALTAQTGRPHASRPQASS